MKRWTSWLRISAAVIALVSVSVPTQAAENSINLQDPGNDIHDKASLRNGAKLYMNHCASCHAGKYMRFERVARDLEFSEQEINSLMRYGVTKVTESIKSAMTQEAGEMAFGVAPPDLSLEANYRGKKWLYTYLMTFTRDKSSTTGYNNGVMPNVAMPWVLAGYQASLEGQTNSWNQKKMLATKAGTLDSLEPEPQSFAMEMRDLTNFMVYMAEPIRPFRERFGKYVLFFLLVLLLPVWMLKKEYWKDIH
ncbi:MAG: cytochrome c1 [Halieaceae bacterium]|jgi:ubiquinol-cytochrome c reductase cytochrome c1 subunit|nr:cytochrome c1 [Halieaceae bacterium]